MLDLKLVRQDPPAIATALAKRGFAFDVDAFTQLDARRKAADVSSQGLQAERKSASKKIGELIAQGISVDDAKAQVNEILDKIAGQIDAATEETRCAPCSAASSKVWKPSSRSQHPCTARSQSAPHSRLSSSVP